jgi:hypothetical protein
MCSALKRRTYSAVGPSDGRMNAGSAAGGYSMKMSSYGISPPSVRSPNVRKSLMSAGTSSV